MSKVAYERREIPRDVCQDAVELVSEVGDITSWKLRDISAQGMQVEGQALNFFPLGSAVKYRVSLKKDADEVVVRGEGKVVWKSETGKMGIHFWETVPDPL